MAGWHLPAHSTIRRAGSTDLAFLQARILDAGFPPAPRRPPAAEALRAPHVARMVDDWPRPGDVGVIGMHGRRAVAAAWCRRFDRRELVSQWADPAVPELAIAVVDAFRGRGWGRRVLEALIDEARDAGYHSLDLQVGERNARALALYRRLGFRQVGLPEGELIWMRRALDRGH